MTIDMLMAQGNECYHKGQLDKALVCFTTIAARYNPEIHDSAYQAKAGIVFNHMGHLLIMKSDYPGAFKCFLKTQQTNDSAACSRADLYCGIIFALYGDKESSANYYKRAFYYALRHNNVLDAVTAYFNVALAAHTHEAKYYPKGVDGCRYPVYVGGGYNKDDATVAVLTCRGGKLSMRVLSDNPDTRWTLNE